MVLVFLMPIPTIPGRLCVSCKCDPKETQTDHLQRTPHLHPSANTVSASNGWGQGQRGGNKWEAAAYHEAFEATPIFSCQMRGWVLTSHSRSSSIKSGGFFPGCFQKIVRKQGLWCFYNSTATFHPEVSDHQTTTFHPKSLVDQSGGCLSPSNKRLCWPISLTKHPNPIISVSAAHCMLALTTSQTWCWQVSLRLVRKWIFLDVTLTITNHRIEVQTLWEFSCETISSPFFSWNCL